MSVSMLSMLSMSMSMSMLSLIPCSLSLLSLIPPPLRKKLDDISRGETLASHHTHKRRLNKRLKQQAKLLKIVENSGVGLNDNKKKMHVLQSLVSVLKGGESS